jgi:transcriptional regulator with XRE-family HTH domain
VLVSFATIEESPHKFVMKDRTKKGTPINPTDANVGRRVKMRRMMLGKSQSALGEACGVTFQQIQKYETGKNRVSASRLQQFSALLDVPVSFFFEGLASPAAKLGDVAPDLAQELLATRDGLALVKAFMSIKNGALRKAIVSLVEEFAKR